jgi:hypothetical protein
MELSFLKKINFERKKKFNIFLLFFWLTSIIYLSYKIINNFNEFSLEVKIEFKQLFFVLIFFLILLNIYSYRFFFFLKKLNKYSIKFIDWSELFFKSSLMNLFLQGSGHLLRAIELKKKNVSYETFININFFIFILNFFFFNIFFLTILYFIREERIIFIVFILILFLCILIKKNFFLILINFIKTKFKFFKKNLYYFKNSFAFNFDFFFSGKNLVIFFFLTFIIFLNEFFIYYIIITNILYSVSFFQITLIFILIFALNSVPFLRNLVGVNELIVGTFVEILNLYFIGGAFIHFIVRLIGSASVIILSVFYYFLSLNKKKFKISRFI